jgi:hypothetical protein
LLDTKIFGKTRNRFTSLPEAGAKTKSTGATYEIGRAEENDGAKNIDVIEAFVQTTSGSANPALV